MRGPLNRGPLKIPIELRIATLFVILAERYERDPDPETASFRKYKTYVKHIVPSSCFLLISESGSLG